MSLTIVRTMTKDLPKILVDQVIGYAESVEHSLPEIFQNAGRPFDENLANQVVFLAGVKKLHSIVASSYWTLDNSAALLQNFSINRIQIGGTDYSQGGSFHQNLYRLLIALENLIETYNISSYLKIPYSEVVERLVNDEHR